MRKMTKTDKWSTFFGAIAFVVFMLVAAMYAPNTDASQNGMIDSTSLRPEKMSMGDMLEFQENFNAALRMAGTRQELESLAGQADEFKRALRKNPLINGSTIDMSDNVYVSGGKIIGWKKNPYDGKPMPIVSPLRVCKANGRGNAPDRHGLLYKASYLNPFSYL